MEHARGDQNIADHLSRISHVSPIDMATVNAFISVFDESALFEAITTAQ